MTVELRPLGVACNLGCLYCYQQPQRDAGNQRTPYNLDRVKEEAARIGGPFTLFGGEPLLMRFDDLEDLLTWGKEKFGGSSIQTNGVLIADRHIELFKKLNVSVGISIDGPGELNDIRRNGSLEKTREATAKIEAVIKRLCSAGKTPGLIVTLHQGNATAAHLPRMLGWMRELDSQGIRSVRLHLLEVDDESLRGTLALTARQNIDALLAFAEAEKTLKNIRFDTFRDMENLLAGKDSHVSCVWRACDPYATRAVQGVEGNGQASNCGRTNKEGIDFIKAESTGFERYIALYHTPQSDNGCSGCRFFLMCKGQCPGTAVGGDWRNRTENCEEWKSLFGMIETNMVLAGKVPLTLQPIRLKLERLQVEAWQKNRNPSIETIWRSLRNSPAAPPVSPTPEYDAAPVSSPRVSWVGMAAQLAWEPRLERMRSMLECSTVYAGRSDTRGCAVRRISRTQYESLAALAAELGIGSAMLPDGVLPGAVSTRSGGGRSGILITGPRDLVAAAAAAATAGDTSAFLGRLALPVCCLKHALKQPISGGLEDRVRSLAARGNGEATVGAAIEFHPLLLHLGLSVFPIIPCDFSCGCAMESTDALTRIAEEAGMQEEVAWLRECSRWALSWSTLHGITEIKTPLLKLCIQSTSDPGRIQILREGNVRVPLGASGLSFPFAKPISRDRVTLPEC